MWSFIRYWLYIGHRWLGIVACLLFTIWFVSGMVMTVVGFPTRDEDARRAALRDIDWQRVKVSPNALLAALPLERYPRELTLEMLLDRPVYRIQDWDGSRRTVSAERIESVAAIDAVRATTIASEYASHKGQWLATIERDQWTIPEGYIALRPLHKVSIDDEAGTQVYVSAATGEVVLATTRSQRFWNWLGSVPHWIYFTELRANQPLWRQINLWVSGPAILVAISGIWIGILRLRVSRRYSHGTHSPYRGWKLWHHWLGVIGGIFLLTWIFSGWLSVNPNQWLSGGWPTSDQWLAYANHRSLTHPASVSSLQIESAKQATFYYVAGRPVVRLRDGDSTKLLEANTGAALVFDDALLFDAIRRALPNHSLVEQHRIVADDLYWYSHHDDRAMPVLRAIFDDPANSWFYIDPATAQIADFSDSGSRRYRWWFNALHRWDFSWLLSRRALWYTLIWTFALTGLALSITGVVIGWKRVRRKTRFR
jgi:hypothetical protein